MTMLSPYETTNNTTNNTICSSKKKTIFFIIFFAESIFVLLRIQVHETYTDATTEFSQDLRTVASMKSGLRLLVPAAATVSALPAGAAAMAESRRQDPPY